MIKFWIAIFLMSFSITALAAGELCISVFSEAKLTQKEQEKKEEIKRAYGNLLKDLATWSQTRGISLNTNELKKLEGPEFNTLVKKHLGKELTAGTLLNKIYQIFGSFPEALKFANVETSGSQYNKKWSPALVINILKELYANNISLNPGSIIHEDSAEFKRIVMKHLGYETTGANFYNAVYRMFGAKKNAYMDALFAAKINIHAVYIHNKVAELTEATLSHLLQEIFKDNFNLHPHSLSRNSTPELKAKIKSVIGRELTGKELFEEIKKIYGEKDGFYFKAIDAAKIDRESVIKNIPPKKESIWNEQFVIRIFKELEEKGFDLGVNAIINNTSIELIEILKKHVGLEISGTGFVTMVKRVFGNYDKAIETAGVFRYKRNNYWTPNLIVEILKDLQTNGISLKHGDLLANDSKLFKAILKKHIGIELSGKAFLLAISRHFESFEAANLAAGISISKIRWTPKIITAILKELYTNGISLNTAAVMENQTEKFRQIVKAHYGREVSGPSFMQIISEHFESYDQALLSAGISPNQVRSYVFDSVTWTPSFVDKAFQTVLETYPAITEVQMQTSLNRDIGILLFEKHKVITSGTHLYRQIQNHYPNFAIAKEKFNISTPWMKRLSGFQIKKDEISRAQAVALLQKLNSLGIIPRRSFLIRYSELISLIFYKNFKLRLSGATYLDQIYKHFPEGKLQEILAETGLDSKTLLAKRLSTWADKKILPEYLRFLDKFGYPLTEVSLTQHSEGVAWTLFLEYGVLINGKDLLKKVIAEYGGIIEALNVIGVSRRGSLKDSKLEADAWTIPIFLQLLSEAGIPWQNREEFKKMLPQSEKILRHHFGKAVDIDSLFRKIPWYLNGSIERPTIESISPEEGQALGKRQALAGNLPVITERKEGGGDDQPLYEKFVVLGSESKSTEDQYIQKQEHQKLDAGMGKLDNRNKEIADGLLEYLQEHDSLEDFSEIVEFFEAELNMKVTQADIKAAMVNLAKNLKDQD